MHLRFAAAALACGLGAQAACAHDHAVSRGRLVFADHEKPVVRVLDLDSGEVTHSFDMPKANPGFAGVEGGRFVVIKTGDEAGTLRILDTGLRYESHGDHVDIDKEEVRLLDFAVTGDRPAHVVSKKGRLALFYDGKRPWEGKSEPKAVLVEIKSLHGKAPVVATWASPAPQHGIAVPLGGRQWLISVPNAIYARGEDRSASSRPDGFQILEQGKILEQGRSWKTVASFNDLGRADASCKLFHGYAEAKGQHVFGCAEGDGGGVLVLSRRGKGAWHARKLAYPDARRVSSLKAREGERYIVGNYGAKGPYNALLRIDPAAESLAGADILPVPEGQAACQFELGGDGARLANLTPDGKLRIYEIAPAWKELASFEAVPAFDCQYGARTPTPSLAVIGASAFVSDPSNGRIREYHLDTLKQGLDLPVEGKPANLAGSDAG
ncbi:hypothetical protein [Bosea sp. (in: a-proteobacteria)]|uniref:hypothetical protein n=1 Tax=Bosea sp. (in: a-proteobacteria) TaxID=1871050 RepID=UPI002FC9F9D3